MNTFLFAESAVTANPANTTAAVETQAPADGAPSVANEKPAQGSNFMLIVMIFLFALFYITMIRPQQRKEKERRKMIQELRAGARVIFAGGFIGTIVEAKEQTFKIEIAGDVVVEVARGAVQGLAEEKTAEKK